MPLEVENDYLKIIVGVTSNYQSLKNELKKAKLTINYEASVVFDISTFGGFKEIRKEFLKEINVPYKSVSIYEIHKKAIDKEMWNLKHSKDFIIDTIEEQVEDGVNLMTMHCSYLLKHSIMTKNSKRKITIIVRGGEIIYEFILKNNCENPLKNVKESVLLIINNVRKNESRNVKL